MKINHTNTTANNIWGTVISKRKRAGTWPALFIE
jgi:hypothetical protein